ncbi:MAG: hypothetical protein GOMPHAMPRED_007469 [Gomphillus americanus]|uniref:PPIase cyclophilin-type domain-containing protein n=1 Tax=Gomphillus americanus TaxID=1940652 RepID=A0A8H3EQM0_9LECA|nr:MAG: hypothetical protein GOMPHAMPRED_007469 [Gomphillus americanus]
MNSSYNLEPPPTAAITLHTTAGKIDLELFGKQTPLATRNFLQLCLNGYYDGTIFHRIVPGFVLQGGDPTGTGDGGEASYDGGTFEDEFHSRLRFNRRGLLGMANTGPNDNGSQFFITLDKAEELTSKNTMFGRVVGDSIYVITTLAEAELIEGSERPLYPASIVRTEITLNPYTDMVARKIEKRSAVPDRDPVKKKGKKKGGRVLLSFEDGDANAIDEPLFKKPKFNPKLVRAGDKVPSLENGKKVPSQASAGKSTRHRFSTPPPAGVSTRQNTHPEVQLPLRDNEVPSRDPSSSPEPEAVQKVSSALQRTNAQIAELKASMKRNIHGSATEKIQKKSALEEMIPENVIRGRKRKQGGNSSHGETKALHMLDAFKARLDEAGLESKTNPANIVPAEDKVTADTQDELENDEEAKLCDLHFIANCQSCQSWDKEDAKEDADLDDKSWLNHALSFEKDRLGKDLKWKKKNEEELLVIDPRAKAKDIKEEQKAKRLAQKGGSRTWDRERDKSRTT